MIKCLQIIYRTDLYLNCSLEHRLQQVLSIISKHREVSSLSTETAQHTVYSKTYYLVCVLRCFKWVYNVAFGICSTAFRASPEDKWCQPMVGPKHSVSDLGIHQITSKSAVRKGMMGTKEDWKPTASEPKKYLCMNPTTKSCIPPEDSLTSQCWKKLPGDHYVNELLPIKLLWGIIENKDNRGKNVAVRKKKIYLTLFTASTIFLFFFLSFSAAFHNFLQTTLVLAPFSLFLL